MRFRQRPITVFACVLIATIVGCGSAPDETVVAQAAIAPVEAEVTPEEPAPQAEDAKNEPTSRQRSRQARYRAPFPNRSELFALPSNGNRVARRKANGFEESVELLGFGGVEEPHAVLAINGVITPVAEGSEAQGVQVISISSPNAVLQRGRNRWTATLD